MWDWESAVTSRAKTLVGEAEPKSSMSVTNDKLQNYSKSSTSSPPNRIKCNRQMGRNAITRIVSMSKKYIWSSSVSCQCCTLTRQQNRSHIWFSTRLQPKRPMTFERLSRRSWLQAGLLLLSSSIRSPPNQPTSIFMKSKRLICDQRKGSEPVEPELEALLAQLRALIETRDSFFSSEISFPCALIKIWSLASCVRSHWNWTQESSSISFFFVCSVWHTIPHDRRSDVL